MLASLVALIVSILSFINSRNDSIYKEQKDSMIMTPAITEYLEKDEIVFTLNNENSRLQALRIIFPKAVTDHDIIINTTPVKIGKQSIEYLAENYIDKHIPTQDSMISVGTIVIPVMIDYEAVVYGFPHHLRENRNLVFFINKDRFTRAVFQNTALIQRCGYPIKRQTYWWFSKTDEKVIEQDRKDVETLLNEQLNSFLKQTTTSC